MNAVNKRTNSGPVVPHDVTTVKIVVRYGLEKTTAPALTKAGKPCKVKKVPVVVSHIWITDPLVPAMNLARMSGTPQDIMNKIYKGLRDRKVDMAHIKTAFTVEFQKPQALVIDPEFNRTGKSIFKSFVVYNRKK